jgi:hypothetical protein
MATFAHRNDVITKTRQATSALLTAHAQLEACKISWDRGIAAGIVDATGTNPNAEGYKANDFAGHEGLVKADITKALGVALDALRAVLVSNDGKKFEDIAL